jgi:hypothetical protein
MGGIIDKDRLDELQAEIDALRACVHNVRPDDLVSLAKKLGREKSKKGKHPTYESYLMPEKNPLSIPGHPKIKPGTARKILDELEADVFGLREKLEQQERKNGPRRIPQGTVHPGSGPR